LGILSPVLTPDFRPPQRRRITDSYQEWYCYLGQLFESRPADVFYYPIVTEQAFTVH